ncbi:MAG: hypothetical protein U0836_11950 [Pirellulales bacterium]
MKAARRAGKRRERRVVVQLPAAMAAGATDRLWSFEDLYDGVTGQGC